MLPRSLFALGAAAALSTLAASGSAHIDLKSPLVRVPGRPDTSLRRGPCGQYTNARDPERVSRFESGQSIVIDWEVYQQHVSYFRIALDIDGDDSFSERTSQPMDAVTDDLEGLAPNPGERILAYVEDDEASIDHVTRTVTLPDVECDNCTLQVIQFTYGLPLYQATYYQCADIEIVRAARAQAPSASDAGADGPATGAEDGAASGCALSGVSLPGASPLEGAPASLGLLGIVLVAFGRARRARRGALENGLLPGRDAL
jgi:hypothetical protein